MGTKELHFKVVVIIGPIARPTILYFGEFVKTSIGSWLLRQGCLKSVMINIDWIKSTVALNLICSKKGNLIQSFHFFIQCWEKRSKATKVREHFVTKTLHCHLTTDPGKSRNPFIFSCFYYFLQSTIYVQRHQIGNIISPTRKQKFPTSKKIPPVGCQCTTAAILLSCCTSIHNWL